MLLHSSQLQSAAQLAGVFVGHWLDRSAAPPASSSRFVSFQAGSRSRRARALALHWHHTPTYPAAASCNRNRAGPGPGAALRVACLRTGLSSHLARTCTPLFVGARAAGHGEFMREPLPCRRPPRPRRPPWPAVRRSRRAAAASVEAARRQCRRGGVLLVVVTRYAAVVLLPSGAWPRRRFFVRSRFRHVVAGGSPRRDRDRRVPRRQELPRHWRDGFPG